MIVNYDPVARYYDMLAQLVFFGSIRKAQIVHFMKIKPAAKVLVVGGGSGWILNYLPSFCSSVTYIEPSRKMMEKSRNRKVAFPVTFIQNLLENTDLQMQYDVIITNFFFDQFHNSKGNKIAGKIANHLKKDGMWIVTDFEGSGKWWQNALLNAMYYFFATTTGIFASHLPEWQRSVEKAGVVMQDKRLFFRKFIVSINYRKVHSFI